VVTNNGERVFFIVSSLRKESEALPGARTVEQRSTFD
jgi:hypothetical protein